MTRPPQWESVVPRPPSPYRFELIAALAWLAAIAALTIWIVATR